MYVDHHLPPCKVKEAESASVLLDNLINLTGQIGPIGKSAGFPLTSADGQFVVVLHPSNI